MSEGEIVEWEGVWMQGPVMCFECGYEWRAVRPFDPGNPAIDHPLECPECGKLAGVAPVDVENL